MALLDQDSHSVLGSNLEYLLDKDLQVMESFFLSAVEKSQSIVGEFQVKESQVLMNMDIRIKGEDFSLLWLPLEHEQWPAHVFLLLQKGTPSSIYVMQLKHFAE